MKEPTGAPTDAKHAWSDLPAEELSARPVVERVHDFQEVGTDYDEASAQAQATRCVECVHPGCVESCPIGSPIAEWVRLTAEGRFGEAARMVREANAIPEICARLCPGDHLCERGCVLGGPSEPVCIGALEQFLSDYALAGTDPGTIRPPNGRQVAVVGAGAAGLACADELVRKGYAVTIYDSGEEPGGSLVRGTAAFRLDPAIVRRRVEILQRHGVVFCLAAALGDRVSLADLRSRFDAVFMGLEARQARPLRIPGAQLEGVVDGLAFMADVSGRTRPDLRGQRVVVVGGDDVAVDCARSAVRCGAPDVLVISAVAEAELGCSRRDYAAAGEEGVRFAFRRVLVTLQGDGAGRIARLNSMGVTVLSEEDRRGGRLGLRVGSEEEVRVDLVVVALGFDRQPAALPGDFATLGAGVGEVGAVLVDESQMTRLPGVFAGGDLVRGPSQVIDAIRDARCAARGIGEYLDAREAVVGRTA